jgi:hypothetical protein
MLSKNIFWHLVGLKFVSMMLMLVHGMVLGNRTPRRHLEGVIAAR